MPNIETFPQLLLAECFCHFNKEELIFGIRLTLQLLSSV